MPKHVAHSDVRLAELGPVVDHAVFVGDEAGVDEGGGEGDGRDALGRAEDRLQRVAVIAGVAAAAAT